MEKLKNIVIFVLMVIIIILSLLKGCNSKTTSNNSIVTHDTVVKVKYIAYKTIEFKTKYFPKWDTIKQIDSSKWSKNLCNFERTYTDSTSDSNVTIYSNIETLGLLKSSQLSYKLKVPILIEKTIRTDSIHIVPNKYNFMIIGGVGGNLQQFDATVGLALTNKNVYYGYEYGLNSRSHNLKIGLVFKSKK